MLDTRSTELKNRSAAAEAICGSFKDESPAMMVIMPPIIMKRGTFMPVKSVCWTVISHMP